jgi:hypothetical protein
MLDLESLNSSFFQSFPTLLGIESFKVYSLFSYQSSWSVHLTVLSFRSSDSLLTLSLANSFVNNFFIFLSASFSCISRGQLVYTTTRLIHLSTTFFTTFFNFFQLLLSANLGIIYAKANKSFRPEF